MTGVLRPILFIGEFCDICGRPLAHVPLTQGKVSLIHTESVPLLADQNWYAVAAPKTFYAGTALKKDTPSGTSSVMLHQVLAGKNADHFNHDGLDNRLHCNLRPGTASSNLANRRGWSKTGWLGVYAAPKGRFIAKINLCSSSDAIECARAYDKAKVAIFGPNTALNFPEDYR